MLIAHAPFRPLAATLLITLPASLLAALPAAADSAPETATNAVPVATAEPAAVLSHTNTVTAAATDNRLTLQPFTVHYKTRYEMGWFSFDIEGKRQLEQLDNNRWRFTFDAEASIATLHESTEFSLQEQQLQPLVYRYQTTGFLNTPTQTVLFAPAQQEITDAQNNKLYKDIWQPGVQDSLSYMLQASLDLAQGKTELNYPVFDEDKIREHRFVVVGEEPLDTAIGQLQAIKVQQIRSSNKRQLFAWFSPRHQYQLIRLAYYEKGKLRYQIDVSGIE